MREYVFVVFDKKGKRIGTINFGIRSSSPTHKEIIKEVKESFLRRATTYKLMPERSTL